MHFNSIDDYDKQIDFEDRMNTVSANMYLEGRIAELEGELSLCETEKDRKIVAKEIAHLKSQIK